MADELYNDGKYIFINSVAAEAYIPDEIFDRQTDDPTESSLAYDLGEYVTTIGIFYIRFFDTDNINSEVRNKTQLRTLNYPNKIELRPTGGMVKAKLALNGQEPDTYRIYKFNHGDILCESTTKKSYVNTNMFTRLVMSGKLPRSLAYDDLYFNWLQSFQSNGIDPGIPPVLMQAIIAKMCRSRSDPNQQFRYLAGKKKALPHDYMMLSMNQVSAYSSVMSSMAFERFSEKLTTSLIMTKEGIKQEPSPIEKLITI